MAVTFSGFYHRNPGVFNDPPYQIAAAAGKHDVDQSPRGKYFVHVAAIPQIGKLYRFGYAAAGRKALFEGGGNGPV
jgi:hypothetical protein